MKNNKNNENNKRVSIRNWAEDDRPREKLLKNGVLVLSDAELIAILIGSGNKEESAVELSRRILRDNHDNLNELARLSITDLQRYKGIGEAKAVTICAALTLGKRRKETEAVKKVKINNSQLLFNVFEPILQDLPHEEFWVVFMNQANLVLETRRLTQGGFSQTVVDVPLLLKMALERSAQAIAVAHNHPTGEIVPSNDDLIVTQKIRKGCEAIGIRFLDHLIIGSNKYYSFADEGKM